MEEILKARPKDLDLWLQLARLREKTITLRGLQKPYKRIIEISPEHDEAIRGIPEIKVKRRWWR